MLRTDSNGLWGENEPMNNFIVSKIGNNIILKIEIKCFFGNLYSENVHIHDNNTLEHNCTKFD